MMRIPISISTLAVIALASSVPAVAQQACVRAANLSHDVLAIDVRLNDAELFTDLAFPNYGDYANLEPGGYVVEVYAADDPGTVLDGMAIRFMSNRSYTVAVVGTAPNLDMLIFDDLTSPVPPGFAGSRIVNLSPDAPVVDILRPDGVVLLEDMMGGTASEYVVLPAGEYPVLIRDQDGDDLDSRIFVLTEGEVTTATGAGLFEGDPPLQPVITVDFPNDCSLNYQSVDYSGMWFDPAQNGQGVQLARNQNTLEGAWYVYDDMGMATFYTFSGELDANGDFSGDLLAWTGPAQGANWDTSQLVNTPVGDVSIDFGTTVLQADLDWSVDNGPSGTLNLVPYIPTPSM